MVKQSRGDKLTDDENMFTGRFWTGAVAKHLGLIDELGHLSSIIKQRFGDKAELQLVQPRRSLFGRSASNGIAGGFGASLAGLAGGEMAETLVDRALDSVEERAHWSRFGL